MAFQKIFLTSHTGKPSLLVPRACCWRSLLPLFPRARTPPLPPSACGETPLCELLLGQAEGMLTQAAEEKAKSITG